MINKVPRIITIGILTVITIIIWIAVSVASIFLSQQPAEVSEDLLEPVDPRLDTEALAEIEGRLYYSDIEIEGMLSQFEFATPAPEEGQTQESQFEESQEATPSATPVSQSPTSTPSGTLEGNIEEGGTEQ